MARCKKCNAEIYFLNTSNGKLIPVDANSLNEVELYDLKNGLRRLYNHKRHISHFSTCKFAGSFRKKNYKKKKHNPFDYYDTLFKN